MRIFTFKKQKSAEGSFAMGGVTAKLCALLPLLAMLLLMPTRAMAAEVTARAEYDKTTKVLRFVMDDQMPADDDNTLVVRLLDQKKNYWWFNNTSNRFAWSSDIKAATSVVIDKSFNGYELVNCNRMFGEFKALTTITGVENLNTANVTDMSEMFYFCQYLTSLDVSKLKTDNVTNMGGMFYYCRHLQTLNVSNFNTSNVTIMASMFSSCESLQTLDVSKFNTDKVTNMLYMFSGCEKLETLDVSNFNTASVTTMSYMFAYCKSLQTLTFDVSKFNTAKVTNMAHMFHYCQNLKTLDVSKFNTDNVEQMYDMFNECNNLETLDVSKFNTDKVKSMANMFRSCDNLKTLDVSKFNTDNVTDMSSMFWYCMNLETLDVSRFNTTNVTNMSRMFSGCRKLKTLDVSNFNTAKVKTMAEMFSSCWELNTLDLSSFNTANVSDMSCMFEYSHFKTLDLSSFNTAKVSKMNEMFNNCSYLEKIYVSNLFTTQSVSSDKDMFSYCSSLPNFKYANVDKTNAHYGTGGYLLTYYRTSDGETHELSGNNLTVEQLDLDDSKYFVAHAPFTATTATYSRTMGTGTTWGTLCLPFEVNLEGQNFRAFSVAAVGDDNVELEELTASIAAGTPVLIKMNEGETEINITESNMPTATAPKTEGAADGQFQLAGLYTPKTFDKTEDSNCYIVKANKLMNPAKILENSTTNAVGSKAFRAYLTENTTTASAARMLSIGGQTTAIDRIADTLGGSDVQYFDMQGRRIDAPQKGMNIMKRGGKTVKIMIR